MRCSVFGALIFLVFALVVGIPMTQGQARTRAGVPFDFTLGQQSMPAGSYEISSVNEKVLAVRNLETREARLLIASMHVEASQSAGTPHAKLVFRKYGDQYFLAEIWDGQSPIGIAFPESKREQELKWARDSHQPELVVIATK